MSAPVNKWVAPIGQMVYQTYYRLWGMVEVPFAPIEEVIAAIKQLTITRGGTVSWIIKGRLAKWEGLSVFPGITISLWIFQMPRNTYLARQGFWKMYFASSLLKRPA